MERQYWDNQNFLNYRAAVKILIIIAFWEALIMTALPYFHFTSEILDGVVDTVLLSVLSGLSIWLFILQPEGKKANQELANSVRFARQKADAIDQMAISSLTDLQGRILYVNDKFCEISGYRREDLLGKDHRIVNSGLHSKAFFKEMWDHLQSGKYWHGQVRNKKKNGEYYWVDSYNIPIFDAD